MSQHGFSNIIPDMESISISSGQGLKRPNDAITERTTPNQSNVGEDSAWIGRDFSILRGIQHKPPTFKKSELSHAKSINAKHMYIKMIH